MKLFSLLFAGLLVASTSFANDFTAGAIKISKPYARPMVAGQTTSAAYLVLNNTGASADKLLSASSPATSEVEIHTMYMDGDVMKMRAIDKLDLPPNSKVELKPGMGYHLMLLGLKEPLKVGGKITLQLQFEKAGKVDVTAKVEVPKAASSMK